MPSQVTSPSPVSPEARATMKDVAERAGVSAMTVSRVLKGGAVSAHTRDRVHRAAAALGYRPNASASAIRSGRHGAVALLSGASPRSSPIFGGMIHAIEHALAAQGLRLVHAHCRDDEIADEAASFDLLQRLAVDGAILNYQIGIPPLVAQTLERSRLPAVWLNRDQAHDAVGPDDHGGAAAAARLLLEQGHRRIAYVDFGYAAQSARSADGHHSYARRRDGVVETLAAAGLDCDLGLCAEFCGAAERQERALAWLRRDDRPTAFIANAVEHLVPVCAAAWRLGLQVPRDLCPVVFDSGPNRILGIPVPTVCIPWAEVSAAAVDLVLRRIAGGPPQDAVTIAMPIDRAGLAGPA